MGEAAKDLSYISLEDYFRIDRLAEMRSDWYRGEMFAMAGGTTNHSRIKTNLMGLLATQLRGKACEPLDSDQRLSALESGLRTYPDASIFCDPIVYDEADAQRDTATNPTVVFEVLSDSHEAYDRGLKSDSYRRISSLQAYLLISQHEPHVEMFERLGDGSWRFSEVRGLDPCMVIACAGVTLPLGDLYHRVSFSPAQS
jgi:Uma2 family endonuclease